jgi:hypothetical protein
MAQEKSLSGGNVSAKQPGFDKHKDAIEKRHIGSLDENIRRDIYDRVHLKTWVKGILERNVYVDEMDESKNTALMYAALDGDTEMCRRLLEKGANVNTRNEVGATPLMAATTMIRTETCALLLENGADTELKTYDRGRNALMVAADLGDTDTCRLLLEHGADIWAMDGKDQTVFQMATNRKTLMFLQRVRRLQEGKKMLQGLLEKEIFGSFDSSFRVCIGQ